MTQPDVGTRSERSHERILGVAARLFRERGALETSVDDVMNAAGLTRGGFYAHFRDKSALVAEALDAAFAQVKSKHFADATLRGRAWLERSTEMYISLDLGENPGAGCAVPALGAEVARCDTTVREVFTKNLREILGEIAHRLAARDGPARRRAIVTLAISVGAVTMARAVTDRKLAKEILQACRDDLLRTRRRG